MEWNFELEKAMLKMGTALAYNGTKNSDVRMNKCCGMFHINNAEFLSRFITMEYFYYKVDKQFCLGTNFAWPELFRTLRNNSL